MAIDQRIPESDLIQCSSEGRGRLAASDGKVWLDGDDRGVVRTRLCDRVVNRES